MKVVILGASGQLGTALQRLAPSGIEIVALTRKDLDLAEAANLHGRLRRIAAEVIVNAAAYTDVDGAEHDRQRAFAINATAPGAIAECAASAGARMLQVSTDFVFGGDKPVPLDPDAEPGPLSVYGQSKLAGEVLVVRALGSAATIVRTSWLYGCSGRNFVTTMLARLAERGQVDVVYDQVGAPTWVDSLARSIWALIQDPHANGIQHWCDDGVASWYDFAVAIQEEAVTRGLLHKRIPIRPIRTAALPRPAKRPPYSVLDKSKTARLLGTAACHWRENLRTMLDEFEKA